MAKFTPYALNALPTNGIDVNGIYFIAAGNKFNIYLRKNDNSAWVHLGITSSVDSINGLTGAAKIDLSFTSGKLKVLATGTGTPDSVTEINLDARYRRLSETIPWSQISGTPGFAIDANVVHKTGAETIAGVKTFTSKPKVPAATEINEAVNKGQLDSEVQTLKDAINDLNVAVGSSLTYKGDIDASSNPNYPAADVGDTYIISRKGKIGGTNGIAVNVGNTIIAKVATPVGTQVAVGANWTVLQSDLDEASETVAGFIRIATQAEVNAVTDDKTAVTPKKLANRLDAFDNKIAQDFVGYDSQSQPPARQTTARQNIGAAADNEVVHKTGDETVAGRKTFTTVPRTNANPKNVNDLTRKHYVDDTVAAAVKWGGDDGKEW